MDGWAVALWIYVLVAAGTFGPIAWTLFKPVPLNPGGPSFKDSPWFSDAGKNKLQQNVDRITGTLTFWKTRAERFRMLHLYSVVWVTIAAVAIPFLTQAVTADPWSKWLLTVISAHSGLVLALSRSFRVEANYKSFRNGESDYYDLYRRMLDRPLSFGQTEAEQIERYMEQVELVRRVVRAAETDNFPAVEEVAAATRGASASASAQTPLAGGQGTSTGNA